MKRNKQETKQKIYAALVKIIETEGVQKLGVNAVAREAGVSKVLLYRYYGGLDGLLSEYTKDPAFSPVFENEDLEAQLKEFHSIKGDPKKLKAFRIEVARAAIGKVIKNVRTNKALQEIIRLQVMESNALTNFLTHNRSQLYNRFNEIWKDEPGFNVNAITSIISTAIDFMSITMNTNPLLHGSIDLSTEKGWEEVEEGFQFIIEAILLKLEHDSHKK